MTEVDGGGPLAGRVAIVTGAASGIGRGIAKKLAEDGALVAVNYLSRDAEARSLVEEVAGFGGTATAIQADVSTSSGVRHLFDRAEAELGPINVLVANAARFLQRPFVEVTEEEFDTVFGTNVRGSFLCMQEAARRVQPGGRIIAISATGPVKPQATRAIYQASKAALDHLVRVLAIEVGPQQITVNAVAPGVTRTEDMMTRSSSLLRDAVAGIPLGRVGEPSDIADVVAFMAGDGARWVTGQVIRANGGWA